jgi:hypothetical protein
MISPKGNMCKLNDIIVDSGAKGTKEMLNAIRNSYPKSTEDYIKDLISYPNKFISQSKNISVEGYSLNTFFAIAQFITVDYNFRVLYNDNHVLVDHVDKLIPDEILIPPSVAKCIFDDNCVI